MLGLAAVSALGIAKLPIQQIRWEQGDITCESYSDSSHGSVSDGQKGNKTPKTFPFHTALTVESRQKEGHAYRPHPSLLRAAKKDKGNSGSEPEHLVFHVISLKIF